MPAVTRFEDLRCWQGARQLTKLVYEICEEGKLARDFEMRNQLRASALSVVNNIAEGFGRRSSTKEFIRFLEISEASCLEVRSITYTLEDAGQAPMPKILAVREQTEIVKRMIASLIGYLRSRK
jgi:four helix bundle protein